jgi:hypothetical protein
MYLPAKVAPFIEISSKRSLKKREKVEEYAIKSVLLHRELKIKWRRNVLF